MNDKEDLNKKMLGVGLVAVIGLLIYMILQLNPLAIFSLAASIALIIYVCRVKC